MRLPSARHILAGIGFAWVCCPSMASAEDLSLTKVQGPWLDSRPFLNETKPEEAELELPLVDNLHQALVKGFTNFEHQQTVLQLQQTTGTRETEVGEGYLLLKNKVYRAADANSTHATRWLLFRNAKTYSGKEIRVDIVPEKIKKGFRYDPTAPKEGPKPMVFTGPQVKYGLILKNIEPSEDEGRKLASLTSDSDMTYFMNAPKADVQYEIGPIAVTPAQAGYNFNQPPEPQAPKFRLKDYLPDTRMKARFSPRSLPTAAKPIPDQTLVLEQIQGYYRADVQMVNGFHKESVAQTFFLPLFKGFSVAEVFDENFRPQNVMIYNDFGKGFAGNFQHSFVEKRYRAGFFYRAGYTNLEIYANLPDTALNPTFKKLQTWELNILSAI